MSKSPPTAVSNRPRILSTFLAILIKYFSRMLPITHSEIATLNQQAYLRR
ncbi:MAG: hypothetical protein GPOALKHO_000721 [Sodalis sp.]|nr:MAG: hypothetical protein GPOALKHO_000721 [Sodalis sp.]